MNLFQKINLIRVRILALDLKKSGYNKFANYSYYELGDFLPSTITLEEEIGLTSLYSGDDKNGELLVVNSEKPEETHIFKISIKEANAKGMLEIQKAGAENTYGKRYAYQNYLNLTENDGVDGLDQKKVKDEIDDFTTNEERLAAVRHISELLGGDPDKLEKWLTFHKTTWDTITKPLYNLIVGKIEKGQAQKQNG